MGLSKISIWRGEMDMQKSIKSLKRIPKLGLLITEKGNVSGPIGVAKLYFCC